MSLGLLDALAERHGIALGFDGPDGHRRSVPEETKRRILASFGLDVTNEEAIAAALEAARPLAPPVLRAPAGERCFLPQWLEEGRAWGISLQLYELRSGRNWGIGDFADLADFCPVAGTAGADFIGLNPLHALFLAEPERCSPFSPSNRRFLNPVYIAVDRLPFFDAFVVEPEELKRLRGTRFVDYPAVAAAKLSALHAAHNRWRAGNDWPEGWSAEAFREFTDESGEWLRRHALFEALSLEMVARGYGSGWESWPADFHLVDGPAVAAFAAENGEAVQFHCWLQWIASVQLSEVQNAARQAGLRIGLYLDFAVGDAPDGSATWSRPGLCLADMSIGAPPDFFTADGQNWGLSPLSPSALRKAEIAPYRQTIAAAMRHAGALRIDHVMGLWRLFFVPRGEHPADGAYVHYPVEDMLKAVAIESRQDRVIVIGEDLGVVPEGFRPVMHEAGILSYRILYFEENEDGFVRPQAYPRMALACLSTHDLPTFAGWWRGDDIALRREHALIDHLAAERQYEGREHSRLALIETLAGEGMLGGADMAAAQALLADPDGKMPPALAVAVQRYIARTASMLAAIRLADLTGETEPTNLPGTVHSYPNWRIKSSLSLEEIPGDPLFRAIVEAVAEERRRDP